MFGFVVGTACLVGLIKVLRHGRGCGGHFGRGHFGGRSGRGPYGWLRRMLRELDATPAQEREIRSAVEEFFAAVGPLRDDLHRAGEDLGAALRAEALDDAAASSRIEELFRRAKEATSTLLAKLHAVLDKEQRERLASFLEHGPRGRWGGPYRSHGRCAA